MQPHASEGSKQRTSVPKFSADIAAAQHYPKDAEFDSNSNFLVISSINRAKILQEHSKNTSGGLRSRFDEGESHKNDEKLQETLGCAGIDRMQTRRRNRISLRCDYLFVQIIL